MERVKVFAEFVGSGVEEGSIYVRINGMVLKVRRDDIAPDTVNTEYIEQSISAILDKNLATSVLLSEFLRDLSTDPTRPAKAPTAGKPPAPTSTPQPQPQADKGQPQPTQRHSPKPIPDPDLDPQRVALEQNPVVESELSKALEAERKLVDASPFKVNNETIGHPDGMQLKRVDFDEMRRIYERGEDDGALVRHLAGYSVQDRINHKHEFPLPLREEIVAYLQSLDDVETAFRPASESEFLDEEAASVDKFSLKVRSDPAKIGEDVNNSKGAKMLKAAQHRKKGSFSLGEALKNLVK